jgi:hypothetical protein
MRRKPWTPARRAGRLIEWVARAGDAEAFAAISSITGRASILLRTMGSHRRDDLTQETLPALHGRAVHSPHACNACCRRQTARAAWEEQRPPRTTKTTGIGADDAEGWHHRRRDTTSPRHYQAFCCGRATCGHRGSGTLASSGTAVKSLLFRARRSLRYCPWNTRAAKPAERARGKAGRGQRASDRGGVPFVGKL